MFFEHGVRFSEHLTALTIASILIIAGMSGSMPSMRSNLVNPRGVL